MKSALILKHPKSIIVIFGLLTFFLYYPFFAVDRSTLDSDTTAMLSKWEGAGTSIAWKNNGRGRIYHTISAQILRQILSITGKYLSREDSFKLLNILAMTGIALFVGLLTHECTKSTVYALIAMMLVAFVPGNIIQLAKMEDNVFSSFVHIVYIFCIIKWININSSQSSSISITIYNYLLFPLIFVLTILVHQQNLASIITPLFLLLFYYKIPNLNLKILKMYLVFFIFAVHCCCNN